MAPVPSSRGAQTASTSCHHGRPPVPRPAVAAHPAPGAGCGCDYRCLYGLRGGHDERPPPPPRRGSRPPQPPVSVRWDPGGGREGRRRASEHAGKQEATAEKGQRAPEAQGMPGRAERPSPPFLTAERRRPGDRFRVTRSGVGSPFFAFTPPLAVRRLQGAGPGGANVRGGGRAHRARARRGQTAAPPAPGLCGGRAAQPLSRLLAGRAGGWGVGRLAQFIGEFGPLFSSYRHVGASWDSAAVCPVVCVSWRLTGWKDS